MDVKKVKIILSSLLQTVKFDPQNPSKPRFLYAEKESLEPEDDQDTPLSTSSL